MHKAKRNRLEILSNDSQPAAEDKRVFCRFALDAVPFRYKDLRIGERGSGVCRDISGCGAGVECPRQIKTQTPLEMWFEISKGLEPIHILGKVMWTRDLGVSHKIGVSFDRPRLMSLSRILKKEENE